MRRALPVLWAILVTGTVGAGGEAMGVRQGQHVRYEKPEQLVNLNQTLLQVLLGPDRPQWKYSTRVLSELIA